MSLLNDPIGSLVEDYATKARRDEEERQRRLAEEWAGTNMTYVPTAPRPAPSLAPSPMGRYALDQFDQGPSPLERARSRAFAGLAPLQAAGARFGRPFYEERVRSGAIQAQLLSPQHYGFVDEADWRRAVLRPRNPDEQRRAQAYLDAAHTGPGGGLAGLARNFVTGPVVNTTNLVANAVDQAPIPYAGPVGTIPAALAPLGIGGEANALLQYANRAVDLPGVQRTRVTQVKNTDPATRLAAQALPYVGASVATGGAADAAFIAQGTILAADAGDRYQRGEITGQQALLEIGMNVGPLAVAPVLRGAIATGKVGARALAAFAESERGQAVLRELEARTGGLGSEAGKMGPGGRELNPVGPEDFLQRQGEAMQPVGRAEDVSQAPVEQFHQLSTAELKDIYFERKATRMITRARDATPEEVRALQYEERAAVEEIARRADMGDPEAQQFVEHERGQYMAPKFENSLNTGTLEARIRSVGPEEQDRIIEELRRRAIDQNDEYAMRAVEAWDRGQYGNDAQLGAGPQPGSGINRVQRMLQGGEQGQLGQGGEPSLGGELGRRAGSAAIGAGVGAATGDTREERIRNALIGAGVGLGVHDLAVRSGIAGDIGRAISERGALGVPERPSVLGPVDPYVEHQLRFVEGLPDAQAKALAPAASDAVRAVAQGAPDTRIPGYDTGAGPATAAQVVDDLRLNELVDYERQRLGSGERGAVGRSTPGEPAPVTKAGGEASPSSAEPPATRTGRPKLGKDGERGRQLLEPAPESPAKTLADYKPNPKGQPGYQGLPSPSNAQPGRAILKPADLAKTRRIIEGLLRKGEFARWWYRDGSQAILDSFAGNVREADRFAGILALLSNSASVESNTVTALRILNQHAAGLPLEAAGSGAQRAAIEAFLAGGPDAIAGTLKTNAFYVSMIRHIDPEKWARITQGLPTNDVHIGRALGFNIGDGPQYRMTALNEGQYAFASRELLRLTEKLNKNLKPGEAPWDYDQVQAAIWTGQQGLSKAESVGANYGDILKRHQAAVPFETAPGRTFTSTPEGADLAAYHSWPPEVQDAFHRELGQVVVDDKGNNVIAQAVGLPSPGSTLERGVFQGDTNPMTRLETYTAPAKGGVQSGMVDEAARPLLDQVAAAHGYVYSQDAAVWHRVFPVKDLYRQNGAVVDVGRQLTKAEAAALEQALKDAGMEAAIINSSRGADILDLRRGPLSPGQPKDVQIAATKEVREFQKAVDEAVGRVIADDAEIGRVGYDSAYIANDWTEAPDGQGYTSVIEEAVGSKGQQLRDLVGRLRREAQERAAEFTRAQEGRRGGAQAPRAADAERGALSTTAAARLGGAAAGGAVGAATGDTPEERVRNALLGAGLGAAGVEGILRSPEVVRYLSSERGALGPGDWERRMAESGGRFNPGPEPRTREQLAAEREAMSARRPFTQTSQPRVAHGEDVAGEALARRQANPPSPELPVPPDLPAFRVDENLQTRQGFIDQYEQAQQRVAQAKERVKQLREAYGSQQPRRRRIGKARAGGMTSLPEPPLLSKNEIVRAEKVIEQARRERADAHRALRQADAKVSWQDIHDRAIAAGGDEKTAKLLADAEAAMTAVRSSPDPYMVKGTWARRADSVVARIQGTVPGHVGKLAERAANLHAALSLYTDEFIHSDLKRMYDLLEKESKRIIFTGDEKYNGLANSHRLYYIFTHPEDFAGMSPELQALLDKVDARAGAVYDVAHQLDSRLAPPIGGRHLTQLWDFAQTETERVRRPSGRPGPTKPRTIMDWREAVLSDSWPADLKDMTPAELVEYSMRATDRVIAESMMRRQVLRQWGTKLRPKNTKLSSVVPFRHPNYAGWYGPPEIVSFIDALYEPGPAAVDVIHGANQAVKNSVFGADFGVMGYNALQAFTTGGLKAAVGVINRGLNELHMGVRTFPENGLSRDINYAHDGLSVRGAESPFSQKEGTILGIAKGAADATGGGFLNKPVRAVGKASAAIDKPVVGLLGKINDLSFGGVMRVMNELIYEGNLVGAKILGRDIEDPAIRLKYADNANATVGTSRGARRVGRQAIEGETFTSARITRSQAALIGQLANIVRTGATADQRLAGAMTLANMGLLLYAVSSALSDKPVALLPLGVDRETGKLKYNRSWSTIHRGGRTYSLLPQKSLIKAIAQSMELVSNGDPAALSQVWEKYAFSRLGPAVKDVATIGGFGYGKNGRFHWGDLPGQRRLGALAPVPPLGQEALGAGKLPTGRDIIEQELGVQAIPDMSKEKQQQLAETEARKAVRKKLEKAGMPTADGAFRSEGWRKIFDDAGVTAARRFDTVQEFRDYYVDTMAPKIAARDNISLPRARDIASAAFTNLPPIKQLAGSLAAAKLAFWRAHPDLLKEAADSGEEPLNQDERAILADYERTLQPAAVGR